MDKDIKVCPICGEPTYLVYGKHPRKDGLCYKHSQMLFRKEIEQCPDCSKWHETGKLCDCRKTHFNELPSTGFNKCILCDTKTTGYAFCNDCWKKYTNEDLLKILNANNHLETAKAIDGKNAIHTEKELNENTIEETNNSTNSKKCLLCNNESGEFVFCKSCFAKYRNKTLLLKITVTKDQQLELLDESYEGLYVCKDGHVVKSKSERDIDNYLFEHKIAHAYEKALVINGEIFHPDFYLPELDVYLEHWGYDESNLEYTRRKEYKIPKYREKGITLISTYEKDMKDVDTSLDIKLAKYKKDELNYLDE